MSEASFLTHLVKFIEMSWCEFLDTLKVVQEKDYYIKITTTLRLLDILMLNRQDLQVIDDSLLGFVFLLEATSSHEKVKNKMW